jgi:uncharacterized membrane protein
MSLKLGFIIFIAVIFSLVVPAAAEDTFSIDNRTAIVYGEVYSLDTFEPLDNAVVYVNSIPEQSVVAKYGMYSFELEPGNYTITAKYYQNSTVIYSVDDSVNIKNKGKYVHDLILLPVYSEELMDSSSVQESSTNSTLYVVNSYKEAAISKIINSDSVNSIKGDGIYVPVISYLPVAVTLIFLLAVGYKFFIRDRKIGKISYRDKTGDLSRPANPPKLSAKVPDKIFDSKPETDFQVLSGESISVTGQVTELESKLSVTRSVTESKFKSQDEETNVVEYRKKYQVYKTEHLESWSEGENRKNSFKDLADNHEIDNPVLNNKFSLPSDLQNVMEIIRDQNGRIAQKDLRIILRCSDAKVSLMLVDLERRELIEKFKRGRGNVIILRSEEC